MTTTSEPVVVAFKATSTSASAFLTPFRSPSGGGWNLAKLPEGRLMITGEWKLARRLRVSFIPQEGAAPIILWDTQADNISSPRTVLATGPGAALNATGYALSQAEVDAGALASFMVIPFPFQQ